ncbi:hypothetical protein MTO96_016924 [Rhipicephalus appendiculatus]
MVLRRKIMYGGNLRPSAKQASITQISKQKIETSFVDAAEHRDVKAFAISVVDTLGKVIKGASIRTTDPEVAEQVAVALATCDGRLSGHSRSRQHLRDELSDRPQTRKGPPLPSTAVIELSSRSTRQARESNDRAPSGTHSAVQAARKGARKSESGKETTFSRRPLPGSTIAAGIELLRRLLAVLRRAGGERRRFGNRGRQTAVGCSGRGRKINQRKRGEGCGLLFRVRFRQEGQGRRAPLRVFSAGSSFGKDTPSGAGAVAQGETLTDRP